MNENWNLKNSEKAQNDITTQPKHTLVPPINYKTVACSSNKYSNRHSLETRIKTVA